jgi:hypothetical protein
MCELEGATSARGREHLAELLRPDAKQGTTTRGAERAHHGAVDRRQRRQPCAGRSRGWASSNLPGGRRAEQGTEGRRLKTHWGERLPGARSVSRQKKNNGLGLVENENVLGVHRAGEKSRINGRQL